MKTLQDIHHYLEQVCDPEVPALSILDLGIVRDIQLKNDEEIELKITPTYSGCPAMGTIATSIRFELLSRGFTSIKISEQLSPAWTTDWMTDAGKQKLKAFGIAPPQYATKNNPREEEAIIPCPICDAKDTNLLSQFGSTSCKALYKCNVCLEAFDYFKCH